MAQGLKDSQLSIVKLLSEVRQLRKENANLLATSSKKQRKNAGENRDLLEYQNQIVGLSNKFLFTRAIIVPMAAFRAITVPPPRTLRDQFKDEDAYMWGITRALHDDIPQELHSLLNSAMYSNFAKDVRSSFERYHP